MKPFYHFFTFVFLFSGINLTLGQDLKSNNLKGKVKSCRTSQYEVVKKFGERKKGKKLVDDSNHDIFTSFDVKGKETECTYYNLDGSVKDRKVTKRDIKGNILEEINYLSNGRIDNIPRGA